MNWPATLADPPPQLVLRYRKGSPRDAEEGEALLCVHGSGVVTLDRRRGADQSTRATRLPRAETTAIYRLLSATGFPDVVGQTVPPGRGMIAIEVTGGPEHLPVVLHRSFVRDLPAWSAVVDALDALCDRIAAD